MRKKQTFRMGEIEWINLSLGLVSEKGKALETRLETTIVRAATEKRSDLFSKAMKAREH